VFVGGARVLEVKGTVAVDDGADGCFVVGHCFYLK